MADRDQHDAHVVVPAEWVEHHVFLMADGVRAEGNTIWVDLVNTTESEGSVSGTRTIRIDLVHPRDFL